MFTLELGRECLKSRNKEVERVWQRRSLKSEMSVGWSNNNLSTILEETFHFHYVIYPHNTARWVLIIPTF